MSPTLLKLVKPKLSYELFLNADAHLSPPFIRQEWKKLFIENSFWFLFLEFLTNLFLINVNFFVVVLEIVFV